MISFGVWLLAVMFVTLLVSNDYFASVAGCFDVWFLIIVALWFLVVLLCLIWFRRALYFFVMFEVALWFDAVGWVGTSGLLVWGVGFPGCVACLVMFVGFVAWLMLIELFGCGWYTVNSVVLIYF